LRPFICDCGRLTNDPPCDYSTRGDFTCFRLSQRIIETMFSAFTDSVLDLERAVILLGQMAEKDVVNVMMATIEGSDELADEIIHFDDEIDRLDEGITWMVQEIFSTFNPQSGDLRFLLAVPRVSSHLELIGDLCVEVARHMKEMEGNRTAVLDRLNLIPLFESVIGMTSGAVNALIDRSAKRAWRAMAILDASKRTFRANLDILSTLSDKDVTPYNRVRLTLICNALYVMACNAGDIAANVVYITHGVDVRYQRAKAMEELSGKKPDDPKSLPG